jgi:uncharacterized protein YdaU (DUF1376 family)
MAKDPAVLFYTQDFLVGTAMMTPEEKGHYITLLCFQQQRGGLTEMEVKKIIGSHFESVWPSLYDKFEQDGEGKFFNKRMKEETERRKKYTESRRQSRLKADEDNVRIYVIKDNARNIYKIGSSVNPQRRFSELLNQHSPAIMDDKQGERDFSLLWYSDPLLRTEEKKIHEKFAEKRVNGEWFSLTIVDLNTIYKTYEGTYVERTSPRTEIETETEIETPVFKKGGTGGITISLQIPLPDRALEAAEMNQFSHTRKKNTDFIKSQWKVFLSDRMNDPPGRVYHTMTDLTSYFLNWIRTKFPKNNATHQQSSGTNRKSAGAAKILSLLKDDIIADAGGEYNTAG